MKTGIKKILPRTLFGRSLLILITPVLLIQIITTFMFFDRHWNKMTDRLARAVSGEIAVIADYISDRQDKDDLKQITSYAGQYLHFLISYEDGKSLEDIERDARGLAKSSIVAQILGRAFDRDLRRPYRIWVDVEEKWVEVAVQIDGGILYVSLPERRLFSSSGYVFLLWMIGASLILLAVAILFMRNQIRPIRRLAVAAARFGRGQDIPESFRPEGAREIRQASSAFLDMYKRIRRQIEQRTTMLAGVSHDLRTPLTRMKLQLSMMPPSADIDALKGDIAEMERMIGAYLDFVRGEGDEAVERTDLGALVNDVTASVPPQGKNISVSIPDDTYMDVRPVAFRRCLSNLVENACKYGGDVTITASQTSDYTTIIIQDDGRGIPRDRFEDVFKPFFRLDESRNPETGGVGLGLPIAQDIIMGHGGRIRLEQATPQGLKIIIDMPR